MSLYSFSLPSMAARKKSSKQMAIGTTWHGIEFFKPWKNECHIPGTRRLPLKEVNIIEQGLRINSNPFHTLLASHTLQSAAGNPQKDSMPDIPLSCSNVIQNVSCHGASLAQVGKKPFHSAGRPAIMQQRKDVWCIVGWAIEASAWV